MSLWHPSRSRMSAALLLGIILLQIPKSILAEIAGEIPSQSTVYRIINVYTGSALTLDVTDPDPDNKAYVIEPYEDTSRQHFQFQQVSSSQRSDQFYIKSAGNNGRYAQINYASLDQGAPLHEWYPSTQANAAFTFVNLGNDKMQIVVGHSGLCLGIKGAFYGANVIQTGCSPATSEQQWLIESVSKTCAVAKDTSYRVVSRLSEGSQVIEVVGASSKRDPPYDVLALNSYIGLNHQQFIFAKDGFSYVIKAKHSGMAVQVANFAYQENVAVVQAPNQEAPGQKWRVEPALNEDGTESDYCFLVAEHSGKVLDTQYHAYPTSGRVVVQSSRNPVALSQHWKVEPV